MSLKNANLMALVASAILLLLSVAHYAASMSGYHEILAPYSVTGLLYSFCYLCLAYYFCKLYKSKP